MIWEGRIMAKDPSDPMGREKVVARVKRPDSLKQGLVDAVRVIEYLQEGGTKVTRLEIKIG